MSRRSESFFDLTLPVPAASEDGDAAGRGGALRLESLVEAVLGAEDMCGSDQYSCDVCGCKQDAVRQSLLEEVPEVLCLLALLVQKCK